MQNLPLPALEFIAFIGFVAWLWFWQGSNARRAKDDDKPDDGTTPPPASTRDDDDPTGAR